MSIEIGKIDTSAGSMYNEITITRFSAGESNGDMIQISTGDLFSCLSKEQTKELILILSESFNYDKF